MERILSSMVSLSKKFFINQIKQEKKKYLLSQLSVLNLQENLPWWIMHLGPNSLLVQEDAQRAFISLYKNYPIK